MGPVFYTSCAAPREVKWGQGLAHSSRGRKIEREKGVGKSRVV